MSTSLDRDLWTIVLAAGEGTRLRSLTRALHGSDVPKQFATIQGRCSLLGTTLARAQKWSRPKRTLVVVAAERVDLARSQLTDPRVELVAQPRNCGTGPGILLPLARVLVRDPHAHVVILPSDHYFRDEGPFQEAVRRAEAAARADGSIVLVGAVPDRAETQYGWIQTAERRGRPCPCVAGFLEKPPKQVAERLLREGALWNTFVMVGPAFALWGLAEHHLAPQTSLFELYKGAIDTAEEIQVRSFVYRHLSSADFSRDVLEKAKGLLVVRLAPCGWSDWGTPARVFRSLEGTVDYAELVGRMRAACPEDVVQQLMAT